MNKLSMILSAGLQILFVVPMSYAGPVSGGGGTGRILVQCKFQQAERADLQLMLFVGSAANQPHSGPRAGLYQSVPAGAKVLYLGDVRRPPFALPEGTKELYLNAEGQPNFNLTVYTEQVTSGEYRAEFVEATLLDGTEIQHAPLLCELF